MRDSRVFVFLGSVGITSSLRRRAERLKDEKPPCGRKHGRGYWSAKSAAVERTAGSTTGRERFEDTASVQGNTGRTSTRTARLEQKPGEVSLDLGICNPE